MKKKFLLTLVALVCALCCAFGLVACGGGADRWSKVKNEAHWKQTIADVRKSDNVYFSAYIYNDEFSADIEVKAAGNIQYLKTSMATAEMSKPDIWEYYYDGEYVYLNVKDQKLDYDWQKIKADTVTEEFAEPKSYIDKIYSGELLSEYEFDVTFDDLDKLSGRYADAVYGYEDESGGGECVYGIKDGNMTYFIVFHLGDNSTKLNLQIRSDNMYLVHDMGDEVTVSIPTTSVQEVDNTNN